MSHPKATTKETIIEYHVQPCSGLQGEFTLPGDKSVSHRVVMLGALAEGITQVSHFLPAEDTVATLMAFRQLGVTIDRDRDTDLTIHGVGLYGLSPPEKTLDLGNSGTGIRLLTGILAGQNFNSELTGDTSLRSRPMARIVDPLRKMGANIEMSAQGTPPLNIHGNQSLHAIHYEMQIASVQVKSCLLLAGFYAQGTTTIIEPVPTRDHTERLLTAFSYPVNVHGSRISVRGGNQLRATQIQVPGDISSAAFFMVAASITPGSQLTLKQVGINPNRIGVIHILSMMGADIKIDNEQIVNNEPIADITIRSAHLHGIDIPRQYVPSAIDEFPILFIAAACAHGQTTLRGAQELRVKESDRIAVMAEGLRRLGIEVEIFPDGMMVVGGKLCGGKVDSGGDHRVAMAFAIAGNVAQSEVIIENCANVMTSFPDFMDKAKTIGMNITANQKLKG